MSCETLVVCSDESRLDRLLSIQFPTYSRTYFQRLIEDGFVLVNGAIVKKKERPKIGDEIEICFQLTPELSLEPENIPLDIIFEDEELIAINKPVGMVTHPAPGHPSKTFVNGLLYHCQRLPHAETLRPGIVHRLDKDTSGILIAGKTIEAHQRLVEMFSKRQLKKTYLAICVGSPGDITINRPIKRHPIKRKEMTVDASGRAAITICKELAFDGKISLVDITLVTGRTHQIRVHFKHNNTPILDDPVYGLSSWNQKYNLSHQLLHASRLELIHPMTGQKLELTVPVPESFKKLFASIPN